MTETRYLVPAGADWAVWDDSNGVLTFMSDAEVVENARENLRQFEGSEFVEGLDLSGDPTSEQAWAYVNELWEGDPGGRGWQARVPAGATWLSLREDEDDLARAGGPEPTFGFGEPPVGDGAWKARKKIRESPCIGADEDVWGERPGSGVMKVLLCGSRTWSDYSARTSSSRSTGTHRAVRRTRSRSPVGRASRSSCMSRPRSLAAALRPRAS
jgi:hypothetical protein